MINVNRVLALGVVCLAVLAGAARAQEQAQVEPPSKPMFVSEPVVPAITPAVRDLPDYQPDPNLFGLEMKRREDFGFIPIEYVIKPTVDPLFELQRSAAPLQPDGFGTLIHNYAGQTSSQSPPDTTGDVGLTYFVQATNQAVSTVRVINKTTGAAVDWTDVQKYLKKGSTLYSSNHTDLLGSDLGASFSVDTIPVVPAATFDALSDVAPAEFWSPFK
jgi:hypothetical protein